jgi:peptidoglycan/LPS O-acetylase OafA/YrhL
MSGESRHGYLPGLDGIRGFAIVGVLLAHGFPGLFDGGGEGVTVFFVLSGYLITTLLMEEAASPGGISLGSFYIRRAGRLWPAFAVVLAATAAYEIAEGAGVTAALLIVVIAASYASNLFLGFRDPQQPLGGLAIIGWTWTLSIEEQFYLAWPLLLRRLFRQSRPMLTIGLVAAGLAVASTCWYFLLILQGGHGLRASLGSDTRSGALLLGCALAAYTRSGHLIPRWTAWPALTALMAVFLFPPRLWPHVTVVAVLVVPVAAGLLVVTTGQSPVHSLRHVLDCRPLAYLGRISYGVYLWNSLLQWLFFAVGISPRGVMVLAWIPLTIGVSAGCARWVERPCRERSRRWAARGSAHAGSQPRVAAAIT